MATLTLLKPREVYALARKYAATNILVNSTDLTDSMIHYHPKFKASYWEQARPLYDDEGRQFGQSFIVTGKLFYELANRGEFVMFFADQYFWFRAYERLEASFASDPIIQKIVIANNK